MRIQDDFHETYAVVLDGYHSFCIWLDTRSEKWCASKNVAIEPDAIDEIIHRLSLPA